MIIRIINIEIKKILIKEIACPIIIEIGIAENKITISLFSISFVIKN